MTNPYDENYFMNGIETGVSNYVSYDWMHDRTMAFARSLIDYLQIKPEQTLLDYGTARGFSVKALRRLGVNAYGFDISTWAIENCDPEVLGFVSDNSKMLAEEYDYVLAKDTLEHVDIGQLTPLAKRLVSITRRAMLAIVPLSFQEGKDYVRKEDNQDATHVIRWPIQSWMDFFQNSAGSKFTVSGSWHVNGLKPTSFTHLKSCGFVTLTRVS